MNRQYSTFKLNDQFFGVDVLLVREINQQMDITSVQQAPEYIRGLINLRGRIVTILDLGIRLGLGERQVDQNSHNIILKTEEELVAIRKHENRMDLATSSETTGLLVDAVGAIISVDDNNIEPPPASLDEMNGQLLNGIIKLDHELLLLLDLQKVLSMEIVEF